MNTEKRSGIKYTRETLLYVCEAEVLLVRLRHFVCERLGRKKNQHVLWSFDDFARWMFWWTFYCHEVPQCWIIDGTIGSDNRAVVFHPATCWILNKFCLLVFDFQFVVVARFKCGVAFACFSSPAFTPLLDILHVSNILPRLPFNRKPLQRAVWLFPSLGFLLKFLQLFGFLAKLRCCCYHIRRKPVPIDSFRIKVYFARWKISESTDFPPHSTTSSDS